MFRFAAFASLVLCASVVLAEKKPSSRDLVTTNPGTNLPEAGSSAARLPVKRVVLYKNGIGYFEHTARVHGNQDLGIDFTTGQLNDVLKSLTVVDLGEGRIGSVRYNSIAPLEERLRLLRLPFGEQVSNVEFLTALRGARVEVRSGSGSAMGRLLSVEKERRQNGKGDYVDVTTFAIVTDGGEMRSFELGAGTAVRLAERELSDEVGRYLNLVGSSRARDLRRMTISALGSGERNVFVSYISEVPVWKSTYRIILPEKAGEKPLLQGWAIVDNTVGEDWKDVQLSLVAGAPQSFVQDISQPYYTRRPVVAPPEALMLSPQTHEATLSAAPVASPPPPVPVAPVSPGSAGIPATAETVEVSASSAIVNTSTAMVTTALSKQTAEAEGKGFGDFFEYNVKQAVTINKNQSALVPILNARVEAEKVTLWTQGSSDEDSDSDHHPSALRALWIHNTSGLTLDAGTFNILEKDTFAGEGILDPIHPGERRLLSYAADTAVRVASDDDSSEKPITRVRIAKGVMITTREERESRTYRIRNADTTPREVVIEHPAKEDWKLVEGGVKPEESTASSHRFRVRVAPGSTAELKVESYHPLDSSFALTNLDDHQVELLADQQRITLAMHEAFGGVLAKKNEITGLDSQIKVRTKEHDSINTDQARLRENMKALKGSAEEKALLQRYTRQLDQQEDRLATLQNELSDLTRRKEQAGQELDRMIQSIALDESF
jgi:hypothetical protein